MMLAAMMLAAAAPAAFNVSTTLGDKMVLQRGASTVVWGASAGPSRSPALFQFITASLAGHCADGA
jgi:polysaccharide pyruvyl transferase WcaK-like protein